MLKFVFVMPKRLDVMPKIKFHITAGLALIV